MIHDHDQVERRRQPRLPFHARAVLVQLPNYLNAALIDISISGALVELCPPGAMQPGSACALRVLATSGHQALEIDAQVVHCSGGQVGLALLELTPGAKKALRQVIELNLGTEQLLQRDLCALLQPIRPPECAWIGQKN